MVDTIVKDDVDEFLSHYGKLGMHWGRRTGSASDGGSSSKGNSADHIESRDLKKMKISNMSNDQIKKLNARMALEKTLTTNLNSKQISKGHLHIKHIIAIGATAQAVYALATSPMVKAGMIRLGYAQGPSVRDKAEAVLKAAGKLQPEPVVKEKVASVLKNAGKVKYSTAFKMTPNPEYVKYMADKARMK